MAKPTVRQRAADNLTKEATRQAKNLQDYRNAKSPGQTIKAGMQVSADKSLRNTYGPKTRSRMGDASARVDLRTHEQRVRDDKKKTREYIDKQ